MPGLEALGISKAAEALYRRLSVDPVSSTAKLLETTGLDGVELHGVLEELCGLGLAAPVHGGWRALPMSSVLPMLQAKKQEELSRAVAAAEALQAQLIAVYEHSGDGIETLVGKAAIVKARADMCARAQVRVEIFDRPPYAMPVLPHRLRQDSPEYQVMMRGVDMRTVYHPGFDANRLAQLQNFVKAGENARIASVPIKLMVVDSRIALIPSMESYGEGRELQACVLRHPIVVEAFTSLFNRVWESAVPLSSTEATPRHEGLVALLMTGATDAVIASKLGVTERSVRRWVAELMERYGVRTRLQLGAALGSRDHEE